ncbi:hypothetical protein FH972_025815 [Carpinus fangiana]|uniref:Glycosyl transferase CAP10 domain-containing protein n=1 Tax=Carpinus fangiana TaxID=176857 RepID=A0A5N6L338_9ROSI|nr:hypothetical protein FH972_025815 [Carpinus fangiana]
MTQTTFCTKWPDMQCHDDDAQDGEVRKEEYCPLARSRQLWKLAIFSIIALLALLFILVTGLASTEQVKIYFTTFFTNSNFDDPKFHPIDHLIKVASVEFERLKSRETTTVTTAAQSYREKRGRHPPPDFDKWMEYAVAHDSLVVESFFDQIYHDIEPFWSMDPELIRNFSASWPIVVSVRNQSAHLRRARADSNNDWVSIWLEALQSLSVHLPDVDVAFNTLDEPRVLVPWEDISAHLAIANNSKTTEVPTEDKPFYNTYSKYPALTGNPPSAKDRWEDTDPFWTLARQACYPNSTARSAQTATTEELNRHPVFDTSSWPRNSYRGYVTNWTLARSACDNPDLRNLHGYLIEPFIRSTTSSLFPLFSGCKVSGVNNDILIPPAYYFTDDENFSGNVDSSHLIPWSEKKSKAIWRGAASGGTSKRENWTRFQRHRLVSMLNASQVMAAEGLHYSWTPPISSEQENLFREATVQNIPLPNATLYPLAALTTEPTSLGAWTAYMGDAAFTHFMCYPQQYSELTPGKDCDYLAHYYEWSEGIPMMDVFKHKYLPDADGFSYSGRWRAFLRSGSLPIKATIFAEWHDSRLVPWKHFVPMDNTFMDWWGIMEYFAGYDPAVKSREKLRTAHMEEFDAVALPVKKYETRRTSTSPNQESLRRESHDEAGERIATQGAKWAEKVLRKEDMLVYMYRLMLEYARVCDVRREQMGWVDDLYSSSVENKTRVQSGES